MSGSDSSAPGNFERVRADFLKIDLQTALTFSGIALQTTDPAKKQRTTRTARRAYDVITRFLQRTSLTREDARLVAHNLEKLRYELRELGETLSPT
jgi:hypothetical protein